MDRILLRITPLLVLSIGSVLPDIGWIPYLLGWSETSYSPLHSMALMPVLLILGSASGCGLITIYFLRRFKWHF